ncbi:bifunctional tRNA (5-methylaminomethyl-2-thiouridine)(34)-methyltransferase MnmD/FAD-dependent 5-carboxymethylaminomethyl-2-thiouridine(34) oxidoreductase MnmC [Halomonas halocynthiae]|uniref:bifunctional tRNA (5-methylaminomethyl-2-thiouridine)(34)-methyltransferase MnmD/FAD-dependent 5-carboxymethylaminomethyl-2-thiouridine(34) oxidoreductase MnmC n=1 Tax=Halomonas halocynthiae TaxID=176290 RepID=UPI0004049F54|nr:bifunctional tRNA (5-methylaminomethyl-2-thiouridine)(34)-methyltransferase MnmD/FAD-dependent 5-carboxymethylaminomethyl-2-thiouridine(34) oxidoreductase MnmC [Halomonas halocynthiae]
MTASPDGLPPLTGLTPARLDWRHDDSGEITPRSSTFDDVYFSRHDGRAETEHVFIGGNRLVERLTEWQLARPFVIAETGFGSGLNMLCAWACFDANAPAKARLHLVSTEKYPMHRDDLTRSLAAWPELAEQAAVLIRQWPELISGVHRLWLDQRVTLDLHFGDTVERLELLDGKVDAWFLDGFAPAKNPEMWRDALYNVMARRSRSNATFATFTCAGIVKRGLKAAGFNWRKQPGFGRKREMLAGEISTPPEDTCRHATPWFVPAPARHTQRVAVIGAGIAGTSVAWSLARRGVEVDLYDQQGPGAGASGNPQGALYAKLAADTNYHSRCYLTGLLHSQRWLHEIDRQHQLWSPCGVLQLANSPREAQRQQRFIAHHPLPESLVAECTSQQAEQKAGVSVDTGGLDYPLAGWVRPAALCQHLASLPGINLVRATVLALEQKADSWTLHLRDTEPQGSERLAYADQVVIATATQINRFTQTAHLPIQTVRGQISCYEAQHTEPTLQRVLCANGYVVPALNGQLTFGATFSPNDSSTELRQQDHTANLEELERLLPSYVKTLRDNGNTVDASKLTGRASLRAASPDKSPFAGPVPDAQAWQRDYASLGKDASQVPDSARHSPPAMHSGLWVSTAHGSRGLSSAPLCAELIASRLCDEPLPLEAPLVDHLHPGRRIIRDLIKRR